MANRRFTWLNRIALTAALIFTLFPIFWMLSTSFKPPREWVVSPPVWVSSDPTMDNYLSVLYPQAMVQKSTRMYDEEGRKIESEIADTTQIGIQTVQSSAWQSIMGSVIVSVCATALSIVVGLMAAVSIARYRFGGNFTPMFILAGRMFPPIAIAIPFVIMFGELGLTDTYFGLILVYAAVTVPFSTWMLKSFVDDLPKEIEEAAMMDGMSRWRAHLQVTVPLIRGGLVATTLFIFILNWSEFLFALVLTYTKVITIPVQLSKYFTATAGQLYGVQAALAIISVLPLVLTGFFIQKHLVRGLTLGAIKR